MKEACVLFVCEVMPPWDVPPWDDQTVAFAKRVDVQDADCQLVLPDQMGLFSSGNDIAEYAGLLGLFWHIQNDDC
jgi:hypothetical protein